MQKAAPPSLRPQALRPWQLAARTLGADALRLAKAPAFWAASSALVVSSVLVSRPWQPSAEALSQAAHQGLCRGIAAAPGLPAVGGGLVAALMLQAGDVALREVLARQPQRAALVVARLVIAWGTGVAAAVSGVVAVVVAHSVAAPFVLGVPGGLPCRWPLLVVVPVTAAVGASVGMAAAVVGRSPVLATLLAGGLVAGERQLLAGAKSSPALWALSRLTLTYTVWSAQAGLVPKAGRRYLLWWPPTTFAPGPRSPGQAAAGLLVAVLVLAVAAVAVFRWRDLA